LLDTTDSRQRKGAHPQIGSSVTLGDPSEVVQELVSESGLPSSGVDVEDLSSSRFVGKREVELSIESSWSTKSWVDGVGSVGGSDNDDLT